MARLENTNRWCLDDLDIHELRLVLKALGGRLKPEEVAAARELGDRLTAQRAAASKQAHADADRLLAHLGSRHDSVSHQP